MRFIFYLGAVTAGLFTVFRIPHLPEACQDLFGPNDHERFLATTFICITVIGFVVTGLCVKKTFPPPRAKQRDRG